MSRMSELDIEVRELLEEGLKPAMVATLLNIPLELVYDFVEAIEQDEVIVYGYDED